MKRVMLITKAARKQLLKNGAKPGDHAPVVKIFTPDAQATWLLSEMDPNDPDQVFGLHDTGQGFPEMGWESISGIASVRGKFGLPPERDMYTTFDRPLSEYAEEARERGMIIA